jgi:DNA-binding transcriptional LysR family regulator
MISRSHDMSRELDSIIAGSGGSAVIAAGMTAGTFILPPVLVEFYRENPDSHITLTQQAPERALEIVSVGDADMAVVLGAETETTLTPASLQREPLRDEELVLVSSPGDGIPDRVSLEQFSDLRFVCSPEPGSLRRAVIDKKIEELGVPPRDIVISLDHPTAIKTCVQAGIGVALLFRSAVQPELANGSLRIIDVAGVKLSIPLYLVYRRDKMFPPLQRRLVNYFQKHLAGPHSDEPETDLTLVVAPPDLHVPTARL